MATATSTLTTKGDSGEAAGVPIAPAGEPGAPYGQPDRDQAGQHRSDDPGQQHALAGHVRDRDGPHLRSNDHDTVGDQGRPTEDDGSTHQREWVALLSVPHKSNLPAFAVI
jgi:hypothetical protein